MADREVSPEDKALAEKYCKRIKDASDRTPIKKALERFERNRKLLRGVDPGNNDKRFRANLFFANIAALRPQVYAKDPEYTVQPTKGVPEDQLAIVKKFCETSETLLGTLLVKRAKLKKRAKRILTGCFATSVGWWKVGWQEDKRTDPLYANQIKDTQDNLIRLQAQRDALDDPKSGTTIEAQIAEIKQTLAGLQSQAEVITAQGVMLDFCMSEDILVLDDSVRELGDYERASALAHGVWMTKEAYREKFGYECTKGKSYAEINGKDNAAPNAGLLRVWEIWDQAANRVVTVCEGEEGFCCPPQTPDWTGERWYPFFCLMFNEIDGAFYPLSDIELTEDLVREYNESRDDFVRDRKYSLPLNVVRKGGSLTPEDVKRISNREGGDTIVVEGVGGQPIGNDIWSGQLAQIKPENYNTQPARADIEQLIGGGDAARGSVLEAKTATEAEILSQGLRGRNAERQDVMEDLLSELGTYTLQMMLRKLPEQAVKEIAGPEAVWPRLSQDQIFKLVTVEVRGGSTGRPDRLQEQDRWTKLLPVVEKAMAQVGELRAAGNHEQAQAVIELIKETLRRFDERLDLETYMPTPKEGEQGPPDPMQDPRVSELMQQGQQIIQELQQQIKQLEQQLADKEAERLADVEKTRINAERDVEVARVKAPIEADAKVEAARVVAEAQAGAKIETERMAAERAAVEEANRPEPEAPEGPNEIEQVAGAMMEKMEALASVVQQLAAPKGRMKVVHDRDPKTNRLSASRLVPDEDE